MSRRTQHFTPLRQDKNSTTYHRDTVARERMSRDDRAKASHLKWDYDLTLKAITTGQYKPMKEERRRRIDLCGQAFDVGRRLNGSHGA